MKSKGYSLIEILLVIAIIGMLAAILLVNLTASRRKARDSVRKQDLSEIRMALELYRSDNGDYPLADSWIRSDSCQWISGIEQYFPHCMPQDPINEITTTGVLLPQGEPNANNGSYFYAYRNRADSNSYDLIAKFEHLTEPMRCENSCYVRHFDNADRNWCIGIGAGCEDGDQYDRMLYADH